MADHSSSSQHVTPNGDHYEYEYEIEKLLLRFFRAIRRRMREQGITQTELAARLGVSQAYISKLLNYNQNLTIRTLAVLAAVMEAEWEAPHLIDRKAQQPQEMLSARQMQIDRYPLTHLLGNDAEVTLIHPELLRDAEADTAVQQSSKPGEISTSYETKMTKQRQKKTAKQIKQH